MTKKRAFDAEEPEGDAAPTPARTEPAPLARTAMALVLASWIVPLRMIWSIVQYAEDEPGTRALHRALTISSVALLLGGLGLGVRGILRARADGRVRRRLAIAVVVLSVLTPVVWASELQLAWQTFLTRERLDAAAYHASSAPAE